MSYNKLLKNLPIFLEKEKKSNNYKLMYSIGSVLDDVKLEINNLEISIKISTAKGNDLDDIGLLFRVDRKPGESDESYRNKILLFWIKSKGGGTKQDILETILRAVPIRAESIIMNEEHPLILDFILNLEYDELDIDFGILEQTVEETRAAGIFCIYTHQLKNKIFWESLEVRDILSISDSADDGYIKSGISIIGDCLVPPCGAYFVGFAVSNISKSDGSDIVL